MASYLLCGLDPVSRRIAQYQYPAPYHFPIVDKIPKPKREYTVILSTNWPTNPLWESPKTHTSIAALLLDARLVETDQLWPLRSVYEGRPMVLCGHIPKAYKVHIMRAESGYLFLCDSCIVRYALQGTPDLPEVIYGSLSGFGPHSFPEMPVGESE